MKFQTLADSRALYELSNHILHENRLDFLVVIFWVLSALPLVLLYKLWRTGVKGVGVGVAGFLILVSFGCSTSLRELFIKRISAFAAHLADWLLYPLALATCFSRLIFASLFVRY